MRPRVLLLDDDDLVRALVIFALEDMDIELVECTSVAQALDCMRKAPVKLLLTDLMMPGESGLSLIERLHADPQLNAGARIVVFSAGLTDDVRAQLAPLPVWRLVSKPASIGAIRACVEEGLAEAAAEAPAAADAPAVTAVPAEPAAPSAFFNGDRALSESYRRTCLRQFPADIQAGDAAAAHVDLAALRRLAHDLKSVLQILGQDALAAEARTLEAAAAAPDIAAAVRGWGTLRAGLAALVAG